MSCLCVCVCFLFSRLAYTREKRKPIKKQFGPIYFLTVLLFNLLNPVVFPRFSQRLDYSKAMCATSRAQNALIARLGCDQGAIRVRLEVFLLVFLSFSQFLLGFSQFFLVFPSFSQFFLAFLRISKILSGCYPVASQKETTAQKRVNRKFPIQIAKPRKNQEKQKIMTLRQFFLFFPPGSKIWHFLTSDSDSL